jgi:hypothetical protein
MSEAIATAQSRTQSRPATAPVSPIRLMGTPMRQEHARNRWTAPVGSPHRKLARKAAAHDRKLWFAGVDLTDTSDRTTRGSFDLRTRDQTVQPLGSILILILRTPLI